jgi:hypothetical protein
MDVVPGGTQRGFLYYLSGMLSYRFLPWIYILPVCLLFAYLNQSKLIRDFSVFALVYFISYFLIISYSKTKFPWYDAPLYPIAALLIGLGISTILSSFLISESKVGHTGKGGFYNIKHPVVYSLVLFIVFAIPFLRNLYEVYKGIPFRQNEKSVTVSAVLYRDYFKELDTVNFDFKLNTVSVINNYRYNLPLLYYVEEAEHNKSYSLDVEWRTPSNQIFHHNDVVISCDSTSEQELRDQYITQLLHQSNTCKTLLIKEKRTEVESIKTVELLK